MQISHLLAKYTLFIPRDRRVREGILSIIKEEAGIILESKDVMVQGNRVFLNVSPLIKSKIFQRKTNILETFSKAYPTLTLQDLS